jgi:hypothetical protein
MEIGEVVDYKILYRKELIAVKCELILCNPTNDVPCENSTQIRSKRPLSIATSFLILPNAKIQNRLVNDSNSDWSSEEPYSTDTANNTNTTYTTHTANMTDTTNI